MTAKIRLKFGSVEVESEGSEDFLKSDLPALIAGFLQTCAEQNLEDPASGEKPDVGNPVLPSKASMKLATGSIAARLQVKSGSDLAIAAAGNLTICQGKDVFSRKDLGAEMRKATTYFKGSYISNLTKTLAYLVAEQKFNDHGNGNYALAESVRNEIAEKLK